MIALFVGLVVAGLWLRARMRGDLLTEAELRELREAAQQ